VRVLDEFNLYAAEESRPEADKLSAIGLVAAATMMFMSLLLLNAVRGVPACATVLHVRRGRSHLPRC
jgi:hypothetical protein